MSGAFFLGRRRLNSRGLGGGREAAPCNTHWRSKLGLTFNFYIFFVQETHFINVKPSEILVVGAQGLDHLSDLEISFATDIDKRAS